MDVDRPGGRCQAHLHETHEQRRSCSRCEGATDTAKRLAKLHAFRAGDLVAILLEPHLLDQMSDKPTRAASATDRSEQEDVVLLRNWRLSAEQNHCHERRNELGGRDRKRKKALSLKRLEDGCSADVLAVRPLGQLKTR